MQPEVALAVAYTARYNRLRLAAAVAVGRAWDRFANVDDTSASRFAETAAGIALAAQTQTAAAVDGYIALALGTVTGEGSPAGVDAASVTGAAVRAGAEPVEVYHRPIVTARSALSEGKSWVEAIAIGRARAVQTAATDVSLTQRAATVQAVGANDRIVGYRRTLTGTSCALCATASTQRYRRGDLMPIHAGCDCGVAPIIGDRDPGQVINRPLVQQLKQAKSDAPTRRLVVDQDGTVRLPEVAVREHGELGPILTEADDHFAGPSDIAV